MRIPFSILLLGLQAVSAQMPYKAGYRCLSMTDSARVYKPGTRPGDALHFRPLEVDIWYPAIVRNMVPIRFGAFIGLLEERADRFQSDTVYKSLTANLVGYLCANLAIADSSRLLEYRTASFRNAAAMTGKFPLLLYFCSYNGICFENVPLFESLASRGFIVASITSVGRYPGNMTTKPADLNEQVLDGLFVLDVLKKQDYVDPSRVGVIGYSWGGLAAAAAAMNTNVVRAVLSFDGSETHYYGESKEDDGDFDELRKDQMFRAESLPIPYGYLESGGKQNDRSADSIFDLLNNRRAATLYRRFPKATHEDFSCLPRLASPLASNKPMVLPVPIDTLALYFFDRFLNNDPRAYPNLHLALETDSSYPVVKHAGSIVLSGKIFDRKDSSVLAYVNIGVPGKNTGTVSQPDGSFRLPIGQDQLRDSIIFSMAGYAAQALPAAALRNHPIIYLDERITELNSAVVSSKKPRTRRIGNGSKSTFMSIGFPLRARGAEMGIKVDLGKKPVRVRRFNFNLSDSHVDSAVFRLNIHRFEKGAPGNTILLQNVLVPVGKKRGLYSIDLIRYNVISSGEVLVSLEWVGGDPAAAGAVYFSAGLFNSATWRRPTSMGEWKKASGIGIGFNLEVQE